MNDSIFGKLTVDAELKTCPDCGMQYSASLSGRTDMHGMTYQLYVGSERVRFPMCPVKIREVLRSLGFREETSPF